MHRSDEILEAYAMATLADSEIEPLECHLLVCAACRERLEETEQFIGAIRAALAKDRGEENH